MKKLICGLFFSFTVLISAAIPLAQNGKPAAEIIIDATAHPAVKYAATELQHWVKAVSGAELPIMNKPGKLPYKIFLQVNPQLFPADLKKMQNNDGYAVRTKGNNVYLFGSKPKGVLNGVFKLLFKNTDIIWARPNVEFGTIYSKNPNLTLTQTDYIDVPVYVLRGWQMIGPSPHVPSELWQVRNGNNWSSATLKYKPEHVKYGNFFEYGGGHNLTGLYITEKKYFAEHPDFFPLIKGKRTRPSSIKNKVQLCFTNPEMTKAFIQEITEKIKKDPNYDTYRIMIEDNRNLCNCQECLKPIKLPDGKVVSPKDKSFRSTQFFIWLNQIARYMKEHYPEKQILTFGYFFTEIPPRCPVESNISISFCPIDKNSKASMESPENAVTNAKLKGWLKITKNLTLREYFGLTAPFPRPINAIAMADWKYANKLGINRTYSEIYADALGRRMDGIKTWNLNSLYFWVMTNGSWNPYQDVNAMRNEFLKRVYGNAADDVGEFYRLIETQWLKSPGKSSYRDSAPTNWKTCVIKAGIEEKCQAALKRAAKKVINPNGRKMLEALRKTFDEQVNAVHASSAYAVKVDSAPEFDPAFNSGEWKKAIPADNFFVGHGNRRKKYSKKTVLRILYDTKNLYFGIKCYYHDVKSMRYRQPTPGKRIFPDGEGFEIFIGGLAGIPQSYTQVVIDPVNNRYYGGKLVKWQSQTRITADGWSGMVTIPWKSLRLNPDKIQMVRGAFIRQFMPQTKPGHAPPKYAALFDSNRHKVASFCDIHLKK